MSKKQQQPKNKPVSAPVAQPKPVAKTIKEPDVIAKKGLSLVQKLCIALSLLVFIVYINTVKNGFVLDDVIMVKENTIVAKGFKGIFELLSTPHMRGYLIIPNDTYRPLSLVMFAMEYQFFGLNPAAYHFVNILVFAGCVIFFFLFLHKFFDEKKPMAAFVGALLFALHPIHTEVVANIKSRDELLCFFFAFLSLNIMMKYMKEGKTSQLLLGAFTLFLSIISKENSITFLGVVPLLFFFYKNEHRNRAIHLTIGTVAACIAFIAIRAGVLGAYHANESSDIEFIDNALVHAPDFATKLATGVIIAGRYLKLLFIPYPLLCNYSYNSIPFATFGDIGVLASIVAYGGMIFYAVSRLLRKQKDPWAFAILFYLMTISLFTNIFILIGAEMADRFLFMASAGICMAVAFAADKWVITKGVTEMEVFKSPKLLAFMIPVSLLFGGMVIARNSEWKDNVNLYRVDLAKSPNDSRLSYYLGTAMAEDLYPLEPDANKRVEIDKEALTHLQKSFSIYPDFAEANAELGRIYDRLRIYDSAEYYDKRALKLNPNHSVATNNLGSVYLASGKYPLAVEYFKRATLLNPNFEMAYFNMARTYVQMKQYDSAIMNFNKVFEFDPHYPDAHQEIGMAYFMKGNYDSAEVHFKHVLAVTPEESNAMNNLGAIYLNQKKYGAAIEQFKKSLSINPNYPNAYSNLGRAYYFSQQYAPAIEALTKELNLNPKAVNDIPYIALSYKALGNMPEALKYEAIAKHYYSDFKL